MKLDPGAYAFQSQFERYRTLRTYYDRVCDRFEAMVDPATWSDADSRHLEELSSYCAEQVRQKADHSRQYWRRAITREEEWAALDLCTPEEVAHTCIYGFAIRAFQRCGMALGAYKLIDRGLVAFHCYTNDVRNFNCYTEPFLAELTGNAKFDDSRSSSVTIE